MKSLKISFGKLTFIAILALAIGFTSCEKDKAITEMNKVENTDADKAGEGEDKPNAAMDSTKTKMIMEPLKESDKTEKMSPNKQGLTTSVFNGRVKVILTLKSIQCVSVSDGRSNSNGTEELYGYIGSSLCESIAPNNLCARSANFRTFEGRTFQRTLTRHLSSALFEVDRASYIPFAKFTTLNTNSTHIYDYSFPNAHYPNIKLIENIKENDFNGWNDGDDSYYFNGGVSTVYLAGLTFNTVHSFQARLGDSTSSYLVNYTIQKIYYE
jgi:hypothetical protein